MNVSDAVLDRVRALREMGATRVRVSADGEVEADFGPVTSPEDDQHDKPRPMPLRKSVTAGLVPRASDS
jgi:hypothetical protein